MAGGSHETMTQQKRYCRQCNTFCLINNLDGPQRCGHCGIIWQGAGMCDEIAKALADIHVSIKKD